MAAEGGNSFPYAGVAVVALFLSTAFLGPHGFQLLRQSETDTGQRFETAEPQVEARLWEDPMFALHRHREKLRAACPRRFGGTALLLKTEPADQSRTEPPEPKPEPAEQARPDRPAPDANCVDAQAIHAEQFRARVLPDIDSRRVDDKLTVLAVLVQGGTFLGAGEARRRTRYALLSGLNAAGYVPDNSERMNWLEVERCLSLACLKPAGGVKTLMNVVFETLVEKIDGLVPANEPRRRVAVLWIDDSFFGRHWLTGVAALLGQLNLPEDTRLRILGPVTSEGLIETLRYDLPAHVKLAGEMRQRDLVAAPVTEGGSTIVNLPRRQTDAPEASIAPSERTQTPAPKVTFAAMAGSAEPPQAPKKRDPLPSEIFRRNWEILTRLQVISPSSTASERQLLTEAQRGEAGPTVFATLRDSAVPTRAAIEETFRRLLNQAKDAYPDSLGKLPAPRDRFFMRTIGTDDLLIRGLVDELCARGLDSRGHAASARIALLSEWDSIYARTFAARLKSVASCNGGRQPVTVETYEYFRGLDGITLDVNAKQAKSVDDKARSADKLMDGGGQQGANAKSLPVEWPEGRDQRDYLRRQVQHRLDLSELAQASNELQAIGIIGNDVHDKLVLAQALRDAFPDRTIFTTDLDARLLHPGVTKFTRNLVIASSLPLAFHDDTLQCGIAPFRDSYQMGTFLAARFAATEDDNGGRGCAKLNGLALRDRIESEISTVRLYEIGREGPVEMIVPNVPPTTPTARRQPMTRAIYATLAGAVVILLGVFMTIGWPGPAMLAARGKWRPAAHLDSGPAGAAGAPAAAPIDDSRPLACSIRSTKIVAALEAAALGFAAGVVLELGLPGTIGMSGALVFAAASAGFFSAFLYPGTPWMRSYRAAETNDAPDAVRRRRWELVLLQFLLFVALVAAAWALVTPMHLRASDVREPFGTFSGVSSWPSELIRTLCVVLFAWFVDYAWCRSAHEADRIQEKYFPERPGGTPPESEPAPLSWTASFVAAIRNASIWFWQPKDAPGIDDPIDGRALWGEYRARLLGWSRLGRVVLWVALSMGLIFLVIDLVGGTSPDIPARGIGDRTLFFGTLLLSGTMVLMLLVLVADVTILTWRYVSLLKRGRTFYPRATVKLFAAELGPEVRSQAARRIEPTLVERNRAIKAGRVGGRNSLLDDWIDIRLLGEHTKAIGPLIVFPFVLIGLMIVARSRLFDNWQAGGALLLMFACFVLWSIGMAALLSHGAERARRMSLERMQSDLIWLKGAGPDYAAITAQFPSLIEQVQGLRQGAFAPFFEQPSVRALLVPLGGAGGIQLLEYLLFAQS